MPPGGPGQRGAAPPRVYVNGGLGKLPSDVADTSGVVEVDVGHGHAGQVPGGHAVLGQGVEQCVR